MEEEYRIVLLGPMRVAAFHSLGDSPELESWGRLVAWAAPRGLYDFTQHRFFGFDNPPGTPEKPAHGYESWITVGPEVEAEGDAEIRDFPGGLYAVTRCEVRGDPYQTIPPAWQRLIDWAAVYGWKESTHQFLEECQSPPDDPNGEWDMDLYLPIEAADDVCVD